MKNNGKFPAIIEQDGNGYVAMYPELHIARQGATVEDARKNLKFEVS